jgi:hypothetical protein
MLRGITLSEPGIATSGGRLPIAARRFESLGHAKGG